MHIPDGPPGLLEKFDPQLIAARIAAANINYATVYAQGCTGHCYWPTKVGKAHAAARQRDLFGELVAALRQHGIFACAYYSLVFNNLIAQYPDWRIRSRPEATLEADYGNHRYGQACPNNADYVARARAELEELVQTHEFDGMFFDMAFWRPICRCPACIERYRAETGKPTATVVNWLDADWCLYEQTRRRWNTEFQQLVTQWIKSWRPGMPVTHNCGGVLHNWRLSTDLDAVDWSDFLSGDFYGDLDEQNVIGKLLTGSTTDTPAEMMTTRCAKDAAEHVQTKSHAKLSQETLAAISCGAAASIIDAMNPDGTVEPAIYDLIGKLYGPIAPLEEHLGGEPLADVGVYFSDDSKMRFEDNGKVTSDTPGGKIYPHLVALTRACSKLRRSHVPFSIVTRRQLGSLNRCRVLILPNVLRMTDADVQAVRRYVRDGGKLYASRWTSLTDTQGGRHGDFALADVFGCHFVTDQAGAINYVRPGEGLAAAIAPQRLVTVRTDGEGNSGMLSIRADGATAIAHRTTSMYPQAGSVADGKYISLHSSPPWIDTDQPAVVHHRFGAGECLYSAADIEALDGPAVDGLWLALIDSLAPADAAGRRWSFQVDAHPCVWASAFHQADRRRVLITLLNYPPMAPSLPVPRVAINLQPLAGPYRRLIELPSGRPTSAQFDSRGMSCELRDLQGLMVLAAEY